MSDSVWPHRLQPTRLHHPWDSPGKNTGVGWRFLLQCMKVKSESEVTRSCPTLHDLMDCSLPGSSIHGIFQASVLEWLHCLLRSIEYTHRLSQKLIKFHLVRYYYYSCFIVVKLMLRPAKQVTHDNSGSDKWSWSLQPTFKSLCFHQQYYIGCFYFCILSLLMVAHFSIYAYLSYLGEVSS